MGIWNFYADGSKWVSFEESGLKQLIKTVQEYYLEDSDNSIPETFRIAYWRTEGSLADTERKLPEYADTKIANYFEDINAEHKEASRNYVSDYEEHNTMWGLR